MTSNIEAFRAAYTEALTRAVEKHPEEYFYPVSEVPSVVDKMVRALAKGEANVGPAIKAACRKLGIKSTIGALKEYLKEA